MRNIGRNAAPAARDHRGDRPSRRQGRRPLQRRAQGAVPGARRRAADGLLRRPRGLPPSRAGARRLRGRRRRDPGHRDRPRLMDGYTFTARRPDRRRLAVRFPERPARRRQFDRDGGVDARAEPANGGGLGRLLQLHRLPLLRPRTSPNTIGKGIIDPAIVTPAVIFGALMGAIIWNVLTWLLGIPSSSSHALVGGLVGAGVAAGGFSVVVAWGVIKTALVHLPRADPRHGDGDPAGDRHLLAVQAGRGEHLRPRLPPPAAGLRRRLFARPRRQRRAEDDGDHHRPALLARAAAAASSTCPSGW